MKKPKLFLVVDTIDTREIFDNLKKAKLFLELCSKDKTIRKPILLLSEVSNYYKDGNDWNYDDYSDTFSDISEIIIN